jgi:hypothetical protein
MHKARKRIHCLAGGIAVLLLSGLLVVGCGGGDNESANSTGGNQSPGAGNSTQTADEQAVETSIRNAIQAYSAGNAEEFLKFWTDNGLKAEFDATADEIRQAGPDFFAGPPVALGDFKETKVDGDKATSEFDFLFADLVQPQRYTLVKDASAWKIDDTQALEAQIPDGSTEVDLKLNEFAFDFDQSKVKPNVAFKVENDGQQAHEAILLKVPDGYTVDQLLSSETPDLPDGVSIVGFGGPYGPGDTGTMVFAQPLASGSYMFVCFLPDTSDPQQVPHVVKGMGTTFQVPAN